MTTGSAVCHASSKHQDDAPEKGHDPTFEAGWTKPLFPHGRKKTPLKISREFRSEECPDQYAQHFHPLPINNGCLLNKIGQGSGPLRGEEAFDHCDCSDEGCRNTQILPCR